MYKKLLLAYDGSADGRVALIEGAELAQLCDAEVTLLAVVDSGTETAIAEGYAGSACSEEQVEQFKDVLNEGLIRLRRRGLTATGQLAFGSPAKQISEVASEVGADLVVIGHRPHGLWAQWLNQPVGAYLMKNLPCSLLVVAAKS